MDDSFKERVQKLFGSHLFESVPSSSFPESSWSVTDGEVERKEWKRESAFPDREDMPCASSYGECFGKNAGRSRVPKKHRFEIDIDDVEEEESEAGGEEESDGAEREEREIQFSIGLDPTLDYEEEEDEYDRAAIGSEKASERMYMRDIKDHGPYMNYHNIVEDSSEDVQSARDPRADHLAANARLKEDGATGANLQLHTTPNHVSQKNMLAETKVHPKPILKRKSDQCDQRPKKQVRFGLECKDTVKQICVSQDFATVPESKGATTSTETTDPAPEVSPAVPDYPHNPSKSMCYTFRTEDDVDEDSNQRAMDDVWKIIRASKAENQLGASADGCTEPPKAIIFRPRKRAAEATQTDHTVRIKGGDAPKEPPEESAHVVDCPLGIAATAVQGNEVCPMEEDSDVEISDDMIFAIEKSYRRYRSRTHSDDSSS